MDIQPKLGGVVKYVFMLAINKIYILGIMYSNLVVQL